MASDMRDRRPEQNSFRIWPGVTVIALCAFCVFLTVYIIAYRSNLIPLPDYLNGLFDGRSEAGAAEGETGENAVVMPGPAEETAEYFRPEEADPLTLLADLRPPELYHQRVRLSYLSDGSQKTVTADVYVRGDCWKVVRTEDRERQSRTALCDGERLFRENYTALGETLIGPVGDFSAASVLGIPSLEVLQAQTDVTYTESEKSLKITYAPAEDMQCIAMAALDTGLITEVRLIKNGVTIFNMYTELFDLAPVQCSEADFFTIPENGGNDQ